MSDLAVRISRRICRYFCAQDIINFCYAFPEAKQHLNSIVYLDKLRSLLNRISWMDNKLFEDLEHTHLEDTSIDELCHIIGIYQLETELYSGNFNDYPPRDFKTFKFMVAYTHLEDNTDFPITLEDTIQDLLDDDNDCMTIFKNEMNLNTYNRYIGYMSYYQIIMDIYLIQDWCEDTTMRWDDTSHTSLYNSFWIGDYDCIMYMLNSKDDETQWQEYRQELRHILTVIREGQEELEDNTTSSSTTTNNNKLPRLVILAGNRVGNFKRIMKIIECFGSCLAPLEWRIWCLQPCGQIYINFVDALRYAMIDILTDKPYFFLHNQDEQMQAMQLSDVSD